MLKIAGVENLKLDGHTAAYALLATLFREETGRPLPEIARTELGKPYFEGETVHFSITHTKHFAFCAFSDVPVGIDAEETERKIKPALAELSSLPAAIVTFLIIQYHHLMTFKFVNLEFHNISILFKWNFFHLRCKISFLDFFWKS